jgi:DNA modification methylase
MKTTHEIVHGDARRMAAVPDASIDLVVTSPPYPMIAMWDALFTGLDEGIGEALEAGRGLEAFERMHGQLDAVWGEVGRVLKDGGLVCLNVGDAVRTLAGDFALYPNHARIQACLLGLGLQALPAILWRKPTNAPTKFMGSGMLPAGAYVTLEHEYVLVFRKGGKRRFVTDDQKRLRRESAFFWEERNAWFSDLWLDLRGTSQRHPGAEAGARSGAFPLELPYRLMAMFSVVGDRVLDPFLGTGTTLWAAMAAGRHSLGYEIDTHFRALYRGGLEGIVGWAAGRIAARLQDHHRFVQEKADQGVCLRHTNRHYGCPVMTSQETDLRFPLLQSVTIRSTTRFEASYAPTPQAVPAADGAATTSPPPARETPSAPRQRQLFD